MVVDIAFTENKDEQRGIKGGVLRGDDMKDKALLKNIKELERLSDILYKSAKKQYPDYNCPLRHDHHSFSSIIFGQGSYEWDCGFCGKTESN